MINLSSEAKASTERLKQIATYSRIESRPKSGTAMAAANYGLGVCWAMRTGPISMVDRLVGTALEYFEALSVVHRL